jgi:hypothetical protein
MYQTCSDKELIKTILEGDIDALYYLVRVKYQKKLYGVIAKHLLIKTLNNCTDIDLEYWLYKFCNYMTIPTKIKKQSKFENIKNIENIQSWLCQCCWNFLINDVEFNTITVHYFDFNRLSEAENLESRLKHAQIITNKFIQAIVTFNKVLTHREKYVVLTYLYCEKKQIDTLIHLDKKIADILNTSEGNIRKIKSVAYDKIKKYLNKSKKCRIMDEILIRKFIEGTATEKEVSIIKNYLIEYDDIEYCYDIILRMRKNAMEKLGIEKDFLTHEEK